MSTSSVVLQGADPPGGRRHVAPRILGHDSGRYEISLAHRGRPDSVPESAGATGSTGPIVAQVRPCP